MPYRWTAPFTIALAVAMAWWTPAAADTAQAADLVEHLEDNPADGAPAVDSEPRVKVVMLPSTAYNPDDGFGAGGFGSIQRVRLPDDPATGRTYTWNLDIVARLWVKPYPTGWELYTGMSWFPLPDGKTEAAFVLSSNGFNADWWFGTGTRTVRDATRSDDGTVRDPWHRFSLYQVRGYARLFRNIGGPLQLLWGIGAQGNEVRVLDDTLLASQLEQGEELVGVDGSAFAVMEVGVQIDTRDARLDPVRGGLLTGVVQGNVGQIDGFGAFGRLVADLRGYLGPPRGEVVLAGEVAAQMAFGDVPFYELGVLAGFEAQPRVLTGITGLRGHDRGRIRGSLTLLGHTELRFRPPGVDLWPRFHVRVIPAVWADAARADDPGVPRDEPLLLPGFGGGIRAVFNEISVVRVDMGTGPETVLTLDGEEIQWPFRLYATVGHSF